MSAQTIRKVQMPKWGMSMTEGTLVEWLVDEGAALSVGHGVAEVETEKINGVVEATAAGVLRRKVAQPGDVVPVGGLIGVIAEPSVSDEEVDAFITDFRAAFEPGDEIPSGSVDSDGKVEVVEAPGPIRAAAPAGAAARVKASPLARRMAKERGLDLRRITGTGPEGRIVAEDVERAAAAPAWEAKQVPVTTGEVIPLTSIRRTIARRLSEAWQAPHFAISMSADMRRVIELREALVQRTPEGAPRPTYSDILTKLCALALLRHPALNAHYEGSDVRVFSTVNVGMAVAIPNGLVVPVIRSVELESIPELAAARIDIVSRTREGKLEPKDLEGGTFTISNLGMYGVERFFAVLNPPQVGILAVGAIEERAVVEAGQIVARSRMEMTLSCDHRAVDGATASQFLRTLKNLLEEPGLAV